MAHNEKFLMCRPRHYGVEYVINPWMQGNIGRARADIAAGQWETLRQSLEAVASVELIEPAPGLPDMTFTANGGLAQGETFIPARFRHAQRRLEEERFTRWFRDRGYRIVELPGQGPFEGEGDALFQPGEPLIWGGYGVRTSLQAYLELGRILDAEVVALRLVEERFYHLDTCFCPLPEGRVVYYPGALEHESLETVRARVPKEKRFEVGSSDALRFACNAIVTDGVFLANHASGKLQKKLANWGYQVVICPMAEFLLAGGAAKCLALRLAHPVEAAAAALPRPESGVCSRTIEARGHLLDAGRMNHMLDCIDRAGCSFHVAQFEAGQRHDEPSRTRVQVVAPSAKRLSEALSRLIHMGAQAADEETDARLETVVRAGVAPEGFHSTTIYPTDARIDGSWVRAKGQRMDAVLVVCRQPERPDARCALIRDLQVGDRVVCGAEGIRILSVPWSSGKEPFEFMTAGVSSERRVDLAIEHTAWEMRRIRERGGKIVVVAGPVVIHTGAGPQLARLIRRGYVQALLGGNAIAAHDIEQALFGTSLGVDLKRGVSVHGGHRRHLQAINLVRAHGGIAQAVEAGVIHGGIMYECVKQGVPFSLAGSIRDDGPLPETRMDLIEAQAEYARLIEGADLILMLSTMLHSIGVGNMTPAGVRLICVDINPAVVTKLTDRGSMESTGIVTDAGLFLHLLADRLDPPFLAEEGEGTPMNDE